MWILFHSKFPWSVDVKVTQMQIAVEQRFSIFPDCSIGGILHIFKIASSINFNITGILFISQCTVCISVHYTLKQ